MQRPPEALVDINQAHLIRDGDELRNINSFEYLANIADKIVLNRPEDHPAINTPGLFAPPISTPGYTYRLEPYQIFKDLKIFFDSHKINEGSRYIYESRLAYGNMYTTFLQTLEHFLPEIERQLNKMFYQCMEYKKQINQAEYSKGIIEEKIKSLESSIDYYQKDRNLIKYDLRYNEYEKKYEKELQETEGDILKNKKIEDHTLLNDLTSPQERQEEIGIKIATALLAELSDELILLKKRLNTQNGNVTTNKKLIELINEFLNNFDQMIDRIYANPNQGLERSANMIEDVILGVSQTSKKIEEVITERLKGNSKSKPGKMLDTINYYTAYRDKNKTTPQAAGSRLDRAVALVSPSFKPLKITSIPSIKEYKYKKPENRVIAPIALFEDEVPIDELKLSYPTEYRMSTQAQYHRGVARVSPIFETWLRVQKRKREAKGKKPGQTRITHIYFNNLPLDQDSFEKKREVRMSEQLLQLEKYHDNIAVITLPADHGLMDHYFLEHHEKNINHDNALQRMLKIATGVSKEKVQDFYISEDIKNLLYGDGNSYDKAQETRELERLLNNSFATLGLSSAENLSEAELQAVYFHFIKFELTDFIITKLNPDSFNMSCKDGIDRGGISSAYYNLMKSIDAGLPLTKKEFIRALHGAPTMVKGRGLNEHSRLIWNAINAYVDANSNNIGTDMDWLIEWRNQNAPPHTRQHYINELNSYIENHEHRQRKTPSLFSNNVPINDSKSVSTAKNMLAALTKNTKNTNTSLLNSAEDVAIESDKDSSLTLWGLTDKKLMKLHADIEKDHLFDFMHQAPIVQQSIDVM